MVIIYMRKKEDKKDRLKATDLKVLKYLLLEGKTSLSKMSKKLGLQPSTINYILDKFEKNKVVLGYRYRFNHLKLGYTNINWVFLDLNYKNVEYSRFFSKLSKYPGVVSALAITGEKDAAVRIISKNPADFFNTLNLILADNPDAISSIESHLCSETFKRHNKKIDSKPVKLTKTHKEIIKALIKYPALSVKELSEKLGKHRNTVSKLLKELKRENVVLKKGAIINPKYYKDLGIDLRTVVMIKTQGSYLRKIAEELANYEEVHELSAITTTNSLIAIVRNSSVPELFNFIKKINYHLKTSKYVLGTKSHLILHSEVDCVVKKTL